jgi:hypothetical protein
MQFALRPAHCAEAGMRDSLLSPFIDIRQEYLCFQAKDELSKWQPLNIQFAVHANGQVPADCKGAE